MLDITTKMPDTAHAPLAPNDTGNPELEVANIASGCCENPGSASGANESACGSFATLNCCIELNVMLAGAKVALPASVAPVTV